MNLIVQELGFQQKELSDFKARQSQGRLFHIYVVRNILVAGLVTADEDIKNGDLWDSG